MQEVTGSSPVSPTTLLRSLTGLVLAAIVAGCAPITGLPDMADGNAPSFTVPHGALERQPAELPEGIESPPSDYVATDDLLLGEVALPSGKVIVGEILFDAEPLPIDVPPGSYPVRATLARYADEDYDSVALLTLELSDEPTARWVDAGTFAVDGGSAVMTSVEARDDLNELFDRSESDWLALNGEMYRSLEAQDYLGTLIGLAPDRTMAITSSGTGDGSYPIHIGFADDGSPTAVVLDFYLLKLEWPPD
jgi:hypothetical protein